MLFIIGHHGFDSLQCYITLFGVEENVKCKKLDVMKKKKPRNQQKVLSRLLNSNLEATYLPSCNKKTIYIGLIVYALKLVHPCEANGVAAWS